MALLRLVLGLAPEAAWRRGLQAVGMPDSADTTLGRRRARPRLGPATSPRPGASSAATTPTAGSGRSPCPPRVIVTIEDTAVAAVPPARLAAALGAPTFEVAGDHMVVAARPQVFAQQLVAALAEVSAAVPVAA